MSGKRDSNSRPQPWQGCALPTELFPLVLLFVVALSLKRDAKVRLFSYTPNFSRKKMRFSLIFFLTPSETAYKWGILSVFGG